MDSAKLSALCRTLTATWRGAFIGKSWIDTRGRLLIRMRLPGRSAYLLVGAEKKKFGFGLVKARPPCPPRPPQLAAYLRAHVEGGRLVSAVADPAHPLVQFTFARRDKRFTLVLDAQPRQPRMFIADDDGVLRCATHWDEDADVKYPTPRHGAERPPVRPGAKYPPLAVEEEVDTAPDEGTLFEAGGDLVEGLELIEAAEDEKSAAKHEKRWRKKLERRIEKITAELEGVSSLAGAKKRADALGGSLHLVKRGMDAIIVDGETIELDPSLEPGENLNRLYDRVKKIKRTGVHAKRRLKQTREELSEGPPKPLEVKKPGEKAGAAGPFHRFSTSDGWTILVGKNRLENDRLVKESRPWDLWFHARDGAGAHVVLVKPGRDSKPTQLSLNEAAGAAAYHSKLSGETKAEVMYTEISRVRKPKGAGPGRVVVADDRTLIVRPSLPKPVKRG